VEGEDQKRGAVRGVGKGMEEQGEEGEQGKWREIGWGVWRGEK